MVYSFVVSTIILLCISALGRFIPALRLRASKEEEELGIDDVEIGEFAYDYVEQVREVRPRTRRSIDSEYDPDEEEYSQRSHSQATMMHPEKGLQVSPGSYQMRSLHREAELDYSHVPVGTAS